MKTLIIYDSLYGNTKRIAETIQASIPAEVEMVHTSEVDPLEFSNYDFILIGAPTQAAGPSPNTKDVLKQITPSLIKNKPVAVFDTRLTASAFEKKWLSKLVFAMGFAAPKMARDLKRKGAHLIGTPGDFYVTALEGPLRDGELERAAAWAKKVFEIASIRVSRLDF